MNTDWSNRRSARLENDAQLEATYRYHKDFEHQTTLMFVSANRDALAVEFLESRKEQPLTDAPEADLRGWEEIRFGRELEPAAHGMLWYAVRRMREGGPRLRDPQWPSVSEREATEAAVYMLQPIKGEGVVDKLERICAEAGLKVAGTAVKPFPERQVRLPYKDDDESIPRAREPGEDDGEDDPWLENA